MDYNNVFAGLPDANIPGDGFWSGVNQSIRQESMNPFLSNANQQSNLETQKAQQTQQEFMSPSAMQMRESQRQAELATSQQTALTAPVEGASNREKFLQAQKTYGPEADAQVETARQKLNDIKHKPVRDFMEMIGNSADTLDKTPDPLKGAAYSQITDRFHSLYPDEKLPENLATYHQGTIPFAKLISAASTNTPDVRGKIAENAALEPGKNARANIAAKATLGAESMRAASAERMNAATIQANVGQRPEVVLQRIRSIMNDTSGKYSPAQKEQADREGYGIISGQIDRELATHQEPGLQAAAINLAKPDGLKTYLKTKDAIRAQQIKNLVPQGFTPMLQDIKPLYPSGVSDAEIRKDFKETFGRDLRGG